MLPVLLMNFIFTGVMAQEVTNDSLYKKARKLAYDHKFTEARSIGMDILDKDSAYYDVSVLIGRTYAWEHKYDTARIFFQDVLDHEKGYYDAVDGLIDVELWAGNLDTALYFANHALAHHPKEVRFLNKKAEILLESRQGKEAERVILEALDEEPGNEASRELLKKIEKVTILNRFQLEYDFEFFEDPWTKRWHLFAFNYMRKTRAGNFIFRVYMGDMVSNGEQPLFREDLQFQYEAEGYPVLSKWHYLLVYYSFSDGTLFPRHRAGLEIYQKLPRSWEISLGGRYMRFVSEADESDDVYVITGTATKYWRKYMFTFRPYISPQDNRVSHSYFLHARRFLKASDDYVFLELGIGNSPDEPSYYTGGIEEYRLDKYHARAGVQLLFASRFLLNFETTYKYEEYRNGTYRNVIRPGIKAGYYF